MTRCNLRCGIALITASILGAASASAWAGRPLTVDDASVNDAGNGQIEAWVVRASGGTVYNVAPAYAPIDGLEIGALLARDRGERVTTSALQAKWRITPSDEIGCNAGAVVGVVHTNGGGSNAGYLNGILTCSDTRLGSLHLNLGTLKASVQAGLRGDIARGIQLDGTFGRSGGQTAYSLGMKFGF